MKYELTSAAQADIREIADYLLPISPAAAESVVDRFENAFALLAGHPRIGRSRRDIAKREVRTWAVPPFVIIYRDTEPLQVLRILHGARDTSAVLRPERRRASRG